MLLGMCSKKVAHVGRVRWQICWMQRPVRDASGENLWDPRRYSARDAATVSRYELAAVRCARVRIARISIPDDELGEDVEYGLAPLSGRVLHRQQDGANLC